MSQKNEASALQNKVGALRHFTGGVINEKGYYHRA